MRERDEKHQDEQRSEDAHESTWGWRLSIIASEALIQNLKAGRTGSHDFIGNIS